MGRMLRGETAIRSQTRPSVGVRTLTTVDATPRACSPHNRGATLQQQFSLYRYLKHLQKDFGCVVSTDQNYERHVVDRHPLFELLAPAIFVGSVQIGFISSHDPDVKL